jgi:hypothetical protein
LSSSATSQGIVKKYFRLIEAWVDCSICEVKIPLKINKEEIINGLQTGIYTMYYVHTNPRPPADTNHPSLQKHTAAIYIDKDYNIKGVKCFMGTEISSKEVGAAGARIPVVVKKIPPMSVHLGMLSPDEFKVLQICDGNNTLEQVATIADKSIKELEDMMDRLREKGLVKIIKRA